MKWKDSKKELPDTNRVVLLTDGLQYGSGRYYREKYGNNHWVHECNYSGEPKFWMDTPEFPEK